MQNAAAQIVRHAGEVAFPDVEYSLPIKLLWLLAFGWVCLGPVVIFQATRHRRTAQGFGCYAAGALFAIATMMAVAWGWPTSDAFTRRFAVVWEHVGFGLIALSAALGSAAALLGYFARSWRMSAGEGR